MSLNHMYTHKILNKTLSGRKSEILKPTKETSSYAFRKGSYTIEAAVVIPLAAGFLVSILFFFRIIQVQAAVDEALIYAGRKAAAESSITDSEAVLFLSTEAFFRQILAEYEYVEEYVDFGNLGISLLKSDFSEDTITLRAEYSMSLPISFFEMGRIYFWQQNSFRKWTGDGITEEETMVYITSSGEVYHCTMDCRSIRLSVKQTSCSSIESLRGKDGQKFYPCTRCVEDDFDTGVVYYTDYGTLYHAEISCSALKRSVTEIPLSEVGSRRKCSFCYSKED